MTREPKLLTEDARKILEAARELLRDPARHTTGVAARDKHGYETSPTADDAVCWCFIGAMGRACHTVAPMNTMATIDAQDRVLATIETLVGRRMSMIGINEEGVAIFGPNEEELTGHAAVMRVLDVALEG